MKQPWAWFILGLAVLSPAAAGPDDFDRYFLDKTMRLDTTHIGNAQQEFITLDRILEQGSWAGSRLNLIDTLDNGRYQAKVYDAASDRLIFSTGFDSYFGEYKTTTPAGLGVMKAYQESVLLPFPKAKVKLVIEVFDRRNQPRSIFSQEIDPASSSIIKESLSSDVKVFDLLINGDPHLKVDVAFVAEGYTAAEEAKLKADLDRFVRILFSQEPYRTWRQSFNVRGVWRSSPESGCDEPSYGSFKNTAVGATFDSLGLERYLLTEDNRSLRDIAAHVPYDTLLLMVNHRRYGGGGIYKLFCVFTTDNQWQEYLMLHEFGHSFAGLADEYYTSAVAYNEFYPQGVEPREPNLTALLDPARLKWKILLTPGPAVPTPWEKEEFDALDGGQQKIRAEVNARLARLKREGAPREQIEKTEQEAEALSREHAQKIDDYLAHSRFAGQVGAFEGAGYASRGLFRPMVDCLMFSKGAKPLCKVCQQAVIRVIRFYAQ
jgi:hypothetical protein